MLSCQQRRHADATIHTLARYCQSVVTTTTQLRKSMEKCRNSTPAPTKIPEPIMSPKFAWVWDMSGTSTATQNLSRYGYPLFVPPNTRKCASSDLVSFLGSSDGIKLEWSLCHMSLSGRAPLCILLSHFTQFRWPRDKCKMLRLNCGAQAAKWHVPRSVCNARNHRACHLHTVR